MFKLGGLRAALIEKEGGAFSDAMKDRRAQGKRDATYHRKHPWVAPVAAGASALALAGVIASSAHKGGLRRFIAK